MDFYQFNGLACLGAVSEVIDFLLQNPGIPFIALQRNTFVTVKAITFIVR